MPLQVYPYRGFPFVYKTLLNLLGFVIIAIGASLGAWLRWLLGYGLNSYGWSLFPLGTLSANIIGAYIGGWFIGYVSETSFVSDDWRLFVVTGFLGGLTTFSGFAMEGFALIREGDVFWTIIHALAHLLGSLIAVWIGFLCWRWWG